MFSGFVVCCRFAKGPTIRSPLVEIATTEGVVLPPSMFEIIVLSLPSTIATQELVVPKSIPITYSAIFFTSYL